MSEKNPRSKLSAMKRQYFLTSFGMLFGIFLLIYLPSEILFTIFEIGPYVRLAVIAAIAAADLLLVNYLVNVRWKNKWLRQMPAVEDAIKAPAPEYVMDEETARRLEASHRQQTEKQSNSLFSRFYRFLSPAEETQTSVSSANKADQRKPLPVAPSAIDRPVSSGESVNTNTASSINTNPRTGSWKTPIDELATAEYDEVVKALEQAGETIKPEVETKPVSKVPSRMERKRQKENDSIAQGKRFELHHSENTGNGSQEKQESDKRGKNRTSKSDVRKNRLAERKQKVKIQKKPSTPRKKTEKKEAVSAGTSWSTPLDEMRTEELETAVENAMKQGYNPISDERNK